MTTIQLKSTEKAMMPAPRWWNSVHKPTLVMVGVTVLLIAVFAATSPTFLTFGNLSNIATQIAPAIVVGVAMTFVITSGQIDLSVGSTIAFVAAVTAELLNAGLDSSLVIVIGLASGALWGSLNGWFSAYQKIPSFIVTLATLSLIRGIALLQTGGFSVPFDSGTFVARIGQAQFLGISALAWMALVSVVLGAVLLNHTRFGSYVTGIGSQEESVRRAGINTKRIKLLVLVMSGLAAGIAGIMVAARLGSGSANSAQGFELVVIAAVVLGGTDLFGGRGTVFGTLVGAILTGVIANGLTLLQMSPFLIPIVTGAIILVALWVNLRSKDISDLWRRLVRK